VHTTSHSSPRSSEPDATGLSAADPLADAEPFSDAENAPRHPKPRSVSMESVSVEAEDVSLQATAESANGHEPDAPPTTVASTTVIIANDHPATTQRSAEQLAAEQSANAAPIHSETSRSEKIAPVERKPVKPHIPVAQRLIEPRLMDAVPVAESVAVAALVAEPLVAEAVVAETSVPSREMARRREAADEQPEVAPLSLLGTGLWHVRNAIIAGCTSAVVHFCILVALGTIAMHSATKPKPAQVPLEITISPPPKKIEPPQVEAVVIKAVAQVPSTVASKGSGTGSDGEQGGVGGGKFAGLQLRPLAIGAVEKAPSGGSGFGTDTAYGESMLGEVGELKDASATFFGVKATGRSFVFVVDTSGSMSKNDRYLRCRTELLRSIGALKYGQKFFVVFFNSTTFPMPEHKLVEVRPAQITKTQEWCLRAVPSGGTEPWDGIALALKMKPDAIYFLTDGDFDPAVVERVDRAQPQTKKIPIHTICFESLSGAPLMEAIAKLTNGTYLYVP